MSITRFHRPTTALLVVDVQERLLPVIHDAAELERQIGRLIDGAKVLGLPIVVTEQYRKGLGVTVAGLASRLTGAVGNHEKQRFSSCVEPVLADLRACAARGVVVCGIEAHVCVLQTCLDLRQAGFDVALTVDAVGSRHATDCDTAVRRLIQAGVVPVTVESILLELLGEAGTPTFKAILPIIK